MCGSKKSEGHRRAERGTGAGVVATRDRGGNIADRIKSGDRLTARVQNLCVFVGGQPALGADRSEEHTSELQSLMRISYAVFCLKKKKSQHDQMTNDSNSIKYKIRISTL